MKNFQKESECTYEETSKEKAWRSDDEASSSNLLWT